MHSVPDYLARRWVGELLKSLGTVAAQCEIALAYEIVWPALYKTPDELLEIVETSNNEYAGIYFDPANILQQIAESGQDIATAKMPEDWLREVIPYVKSVHMKEYSFASGFVDLLSGDVNWKKIGQIFNEAGYDGWLVAEIEVEPTNHRTAIAQSSTAIDQFISEYC